MLLKNLRLINAQWVKQIEEARTLWIHETDKCRVGQLRFHVLRTGEKDSVTIAQLGARGMCSLVEPCGGAAFASNGVFGASDGNGEYRVAHALKCVD